MSRSISPPLQNQLVLQNDLYKIDTSLNGRHIQLSCFAFYVLVMLTTVKISVTCKLLTYPLLPGANAAAKLLAGRQGAFAIEFARCGFFSALGNLVTGIEGGVSIYIAEENGIQNEKDYCYFSIA